MLVLPTYMMHRLLPIPCPAEMTTPSGFRELQKKTAVRSAAGFSSALFPICAAACVKNQGYTYKARSLGHVKQPGTKYFAIVSQLQCLRENYETVGR